MNGFAKIRFPYLIPAVFALISLFAFSSCRPTGKLTQGQYIVESVEVLNVKPTHIPRENFEAFYRQKPNRKFLRKVHFFVWWYNHFDNEKIKLKKAKRNEKYDRLNAKKVKQHEAKNARRIKKGKKIRKHQPRLKDKESPLFIESLRDIGEPAVVLDSSMTRQTTRQLSRYLFGKGFFDNQTRDSVVYNYRKKRAHIKYILVPGKPYLVSEIIYKCDDPELARLVLPDSVNCLLKKGESYDFEKQQAEKQRITDLAANNGYYYFENAYSDIEVDSSHKNHTASIHIHIKKYARQYSSANDSLVLVSHPKLKVHNIYVITEPFIGNVRDAHFKDTLRSKKPGLVFLLNKALAFREAVLVNNIDIYRGQLFRRDTAQLTYRELLSLGIFRNVSIQFLVSSENSSLLDCYIVCNPLVKQSLAAETEGTNTSGNLGIDGSLVYQNRNFFRGGEFVELKLQGALIAQSQLSSQEKSGADLGDFSNSFNTLQFGPELTFAVPRAFFPFSLLPFKKEQSPRTYVKSSLNFQARPEFTRDITSINYGFSFKTHANTLKHDFIPLEIYYVNARLSSSFKNTLLDLNDAFLVNSFQNHITTLSRYTLTFITKENTNTSRKTVSYLRWSISSSGNLLRALFNATGHSKDSLNRYLVLGIPFAHFVKSDIDYRIYIPVRKKSRVVYRVAGGIGRPLTNLNVLPYEQSFFSGGPNSVRAWRARTLGPGGYDPSNSTARYDKIGDILLEGNFEYRFHVIGSFNGAFFVDAGNIWRLYPDAGKPDAEFIPNRFADQIAIGTGLGVRWDLNFFVLRLDLAMPLKDPKLSPGQRWAFDKQPWQYTIANFGIGYPF